MKKLSYHSLQALGSMGDCVIFTYPVDCFALSLILTDLSKIIMFIMAALRKQCVLAAACVCKICILSWT